MKKLIRLLVGFFFPSVVTTSYPSSIQPVPAGIQPDNQGFAGFFGMLANLDAIDWDFLALIGGSATTITLTGAQFFQNVIDYSGSPAGAVTVTTPTATQIITAMPPTIPANGYNFPWDFINDGSGQTVTLVGGTNVTVQGTATIANNTCREYIIAVNVQLGTVNIINMGSKTL